MAERRHGPAAGWTAACAVGLAAALWTPPTPAAPACAPLASAALPAQGFAAAAARVAPSVVKVVVVRPRRDPADEFGGPGDFFQEMAGLPLPGNAEADMPERSFASGFAVGGRTVLTSAHAVFDAGEVWIVDATGRRLRAAVAGYDRRSDVGVLRLGGDASLPAAAPAAAPPCSGDWVGALGAPFGFDQTFTAGVVSAYPRFLPGSLAAPLIQTDAVLNPGSSGGPLFDAQGRVVGMNSMIYSASGVYTGVSFALPIGVVLQVARQLELGDAAAPGHLGAITQPVTPELARAFGLDVPRGALVVRAEPGSPAEQAGLLPGDVVLALDGAPVASQEKLIDAIGAAPPGSPVALGIRRAGKDLTVAARLGPIPGRMHAPVQPAAPRMESRLGLVLAPLRPGGTTRAGLYVDYATGSSLLAGLETGDLVTGVNGMPVASLAEFDAALEGAGGAPVVALLVWRGNSALYVAVSRGS